MGNIFKEQGNYSKAIDYYFKALRIDEEFGNKAGVARHYGNLGTLYTMQEDNAKALDYFLKSLKMNEGLGFKEQISTNLGNIGLVYFAKKDYSTALNYYQRALKMNEEIGNPQEILINLSNIGSVYQEQGDNERALATQLKVIKIAEKLQLKNVIAATLGNIGANYFKEKKYGPAEDYFKRALALNLEIGLLKQVTELNRMLHNLYVTTNDHKAALIHYKNYILYRDSLLNKENSKKQVELEMQYSFDKKEALAGAEQAKKDALNKEELKKQRMQRNGFIIGFALMIALAAVIYRNFRTKSKANAIISKQKEEVELQREIAENQKLLVEEKNKEILDSITYAKRLQLAILPPEKFVKDLLPNSFILYKPKDIVAGDFYWMHIVESSEFGVQSAEPISELRTKNSELILIAAADCTGHGVPGAIVSVVCSNALNRAVKEFGLNEPGKILDKVRELVVETFERSESEVKDGMDIALCSLQKNRSGYTLQYAGANNPLWLIRKNTTDGKFELIETRADKQPIGKYPNSKPFNANTIELQKGDTIYIFTDGYSDQFGGDTGKKLKTANSKKLLLSIQEKSMEEQFKLVDDFFETWKGKNEQVDDVCMIGIRV
jgi:serine phosphatase RsbU (regulator of sigma subunit)/Tfp pilus assembly protein PilF